MALYSYVKNKTTEKSILLRYFSFLSISFGVIILAIVLYPIFSFDVVYGRKFANIATPIPNESPFQIQSQALSAYRSKKINLINTQDTKIDYTKARFWFPKAKAEQLPQTTSSYTLDIPKFGIFQATVVVGGDDLTKSLIHFTGPLPGNNGSPIIFGHSTIPFLYNPSDYKSIFSKLPEFEEDDDIFVKIDNITYHYKVYDMKVVSPDTLQVLNQNFNSPEITLITCVPLGTYRDRLVIKAKLEKI